MHCMRQSTRSALETLANPGSLHPITNLIKTRLTELGTRGVEVQWCWMKTHVGLPGNERADELVKEGASRIRGPRCTPMAKRLIRSSTLEHWQRRYDETWTGETSKIFFVCVTGAYRTIRAYNDSNVMTQILTGHGGIRAYLYRFRLADSPNCAIAETVEYIIRHCPRFGSLRHDCEQELRVSFEECGPREIMG